MRARLIRILLWLAEKLGYESDLDYRGLLLNVIRRPQAWRSGGTRGAIEQAAPAPRVAQVLRFVRDHEFPRPGEVENEFREAQRRRC